MIHTIADLLKAFKDSEAKLLESYEIVKHPGIIGDMYEGLTKDILGKSIFAGLDLKVSAGKIKNSKDEFSGEIDCMLVVGNGEKIPHTDKYIYDSSKVVAVIQVKKNLYTKDIQDSFSNLKTVIDTTEERDGEINHSRLLSSSFKLICRRELPARSELDQLPFELQMIYHILSLEAFYPARIVWGYNGFKSEFTLRESMIKFLNGKISTPEKKIRGFDPLGFPNLIICGNSTLIKNNGIPFASPITDGNWWTFLGSSNENPVYFFLEIIWTRLHFMFNISSEIFGDDLLMNEVHGFMLARAKRKESYNGWEYFYVSTKKEELDQPLEHKDWEPVFLDECQFIIINELCTAGRVAYKNDRDLEKFVSSYGYSLESFSKGLKETGLVHVENGIFKLLTESCVVGISNDGKYFAGENNSGRVERWIKRESKRNTTPPL